MGLGCSHYGQQENTFCKLCGYPVPPDPKTALRERFRNVIILAGYQGKAVEGILEEWFEKYYADPDRAKFIKMLEEYEQRYKEDGEII
jgi:hypothetical protein